MTDVSARAKCLELAESVYKKGLSVPAIFFLEIYKPLCGISGAGMDVLAPLLKLIASGEKIDLIKEIIESRENIEIIIKEIERLNK